MTSRLDISPEVLDRAIGSLLGLAVGDALGTTLEFSRRDTRPHRTEITGGGPFGLGAGQWTDDTSMAIALGESLIACRGFDAFDLMERFVAWWKTGEYSCTGTCFDIGVTTRHALARYLETGETFAGSTAEHTAGNGSLMRLAPAVLFGLRDAELATRIAREQSRTTHGAPQAVDACDLLSRLLLAAITTGDRKSIQAPMVWEGHAALAAIAAGGYRSKERDEIESSGYAVAILEAALWAVANTATFEDAVILAVNLANDADTVGAVTGQIAGALYGGASIPSRWLEHLAWSGRLRSLAISLVEFAPSPKQ